MKFLCIAACLAVAGAAPQRSPQRAPAQRSYRFETPASVSALPAANVAPVYERSADLGRAPAAAADPNYKVPAILDLQRNMEAGGNYQFSFDTENGIHTIEKSVQHSVRDEKNEEHVVPSKEGSYTYTGPDGQQYTVNYIADEFGFRATGAHLPVAPEIPPEIQRSLEILKSLPPTPPPKFS